MGFFSEMCDTFTDRCGEFRGKVDSASPEIWLGLSLVAMVGAVVTSAIAGRKIDSIVEDHLARVEEAKKETIVTSDGVEVVKTQKEINSLVRKEYFVTGGKFVKNFAVTGILVGVGGFAEFKCYDTQAKWVMGLTTAYTGLQETFRRYQENNIKLNGVDNHNMCKYGYVEETVRDENGNEVVKRRAKTAEEVAKDKGYDPEAYSGMYIINKDNCSLITGTAAVDMLTLQQVQEDIKRYVVTHHCITEKEIIDRLGLKEETCTQNLIWGLVKGLEDNFDIGLDSPVNNKTLAGYPNEDICLTFSGLINLHEYFKRKDAAEYLISREAIQNSTRG